MTINEYISNIKKRYQTGISREHAYRGDLQQLLETLLPDTIVTNEPARISCGSPDYVITRKDIPIGYIEAKDIGIDLDKTLKSEQIKRYTDSLDNLILTDYVTFIFLKDGEVYETLDLFDLYTDRQFVNGVDKTEQRYKRFELLIRDFSTHITQTIKSPTKLASMMANKAKLLAQVINNALTSDVESNANSSLKEQMEAFKQILIHDIKPAEFADIYAQTIAYGMFAARLHDPTPDTFSRQEAASLIPKSNPFLRKLFQYISGYDIDERIEWIVSALADIFRATDVGEILKDFGKATQMNDPFIHFYEFFLAEYDPKLRKARGVWYTPEPVVNFIVRAVDDLLKSEFGLPKGLADNSKIDVVERSQNRDSRFASGYKETTKQVHRVQILDPATGTGTFLAEVVKHIYGTRFKNMQGAWPQYVENDLIPRLNGFEILMASYAMAHLKLDLLLGETGYKATKDQRFKIFLTNSLEEANPDTGTLFANWLSSEASEANAIKKDTPVMCIIGNPPYSNSSQNKGTWITHLIEDYKDGLNERRSHLGDDYIKFLRYAEYLVMKNGEGVVAYISNNSFYDGLTHRIMRKKLFEGFSTIYVLNLHGDSNKKETTPSGDKDENVFDIKQGVGITFLIKAKNREGCKVYYKDLFGIRNLKNEALFDIELKRDFEEIHPQKTEMYYFVSGEDDEIQDEYSKGISLTNIFTTYNSGIQTKRDALVYSANIENLQAKTNDFKTLNDEQIRAKYNLPADGRDWKIPFAKSDIERGTQPIKVAYRPFDNKYTAYSGNSKGFIAYPRTSITKHLILDNLCFISCRQTKSNPGAFISKNPIDQKIFSAYDINSMFPVFLYEQSLDGTMNKVSNFQTSYIERLEDATNLNFRLNETKENSFDAIDVVAYLYSYLNMPKYILKYKKLLKTGFPRIPLPHSTDEFYTLVNFGRRLIDVHLMENSSVDISFINYPQGGHNRIDRKMTKSSPGFELTNEENKTGKVWINDEQYFDDVPVLAWNFYIGGYQPAQKWLKDRQGRLLNYDDIEHYQKIIAALVETDKIMKEIDELGVV